MSIVMPYSKFDVADWAKRTPEPFDLAIAGWHREVTAGALPNELHIALTNGAQRIHAIRWWDRPLHPGEPLVTASERIVELDGRRYTIVTTPSGEQLTWLRPEKWCGWMPCVEIPKPHEKWSGRLGFTGCEPADVELALANLVYAETRRFPSHSCAPKFVVK